MILWSVVAGTLLGWVAGGFGTFGAVLGAVIGAIMGRWLQSAVRREILRASQEVLGSRSVHESSVALSPALGPSPALEPAPIATAFMGSQIPNADKDNDPVSPPSPTFEEQPPKLSLTEELWSKARDWFFGGNTIVRVGLVILFVGLTFLVRLVAHAGLFPIEVRLALVAVAGAALVAVGFTRRNARPAFGLALQGTGVAVLYLTVFAAARIFGLLPPAVAFGLMILFAALGCALALLQDARGLAFASFLGGFAVPILLGGNARTPLGLFTYITILNLALLAIAWRRSWRELNLLGFASTFGLATLWGMTSYEPQHYLLCQVFLAITMAIYVCVPTLYAGNTPGRLGNAADTTLLFGPAIAGFGLEVGLVADRPFGSAFAALAFGAGYLAVYAAMLRRRGREMQVVNECLLAIGIGFVTLAVPLALDAQWTSSAWALEGAGAFWVGKRQARWVPRLFGLLLQGIAAVIVVSTLAPTVSEYPLANSGFVGAALVALPLLMTAWWMRQRLPHSGSRLAEIYGEAEFSLRHAVFLAAFALVATALLQEVSRQRPVSGVGQPGRPVFEAYQQVLLAMLAMIGAAAISDWFGRRQNWEVASWPARATLPVLALSFLATVVMGRHLLFWPDWTAWLLALGGHFALLRRGDLGPGGERSAALMNWNRLVHAGGVWLLTAMLADCLWLGIDRGALWNTSWAGVIFLISTVGILGALTMVAGRAAPLSSTEGLQWPLHPAARSYWWVAAVPLAAVTYLGALTAALTEEGTADPLPFVPLINPVDLSVGLALVTLVLWRRTVQRAHERPSAAYSLLGSVGLIAGAVLAFAAINGAWLRTAHHWIGIGWSLEALGQSSVVQTGLAILWTLLAMGLMLFAHRRALRVSWLIGAGLLVAVVLKLLLVDMSNAQGWERIVTFIGVGVLMLVIGYFVPLPPRQRRTERAA